MSTQLIVVIIAAVVAVAAVFYARSVKTDANSATLSAGQALGAGIVGLGILLLASYGHNPVMFVILTGIVFFAWGEIYSLFPATCGDTFGPKFAATNAGLLYTAKGTAALLVPLCSVLATNYGWQAVFLTAMACNISAVSITVRVIGVT
mgnify:CR=1 FL=1